MCIRDRYYCAKVDPDVRDDLIDYLADKKIHTSVHFKPLHLYDVVKDMNQRDYPVADVEWKKLISLPCHPGMSDEDIDYVIYWVSQYFSENIFFEEPDIEVTPWWKFW